MAEPLDLRILFHGSRIMPPLVNPFPMPAGVALPARSPQSQPRPVSQAETPQTQSAQ